MEIKIAIKKKKPLFCLPFLHPRPPLFAARSAQYARALSLELLSTCAPAHPPRWFHTLVCCPMNSARSRTRLWFSLLRDHHILPCLSPFWWPPRLLGQRTVWPYHSSVPSDLSTRGSQQRLPALRAFGPQSHKDTLLRRPGRFWGQIPSHALTHHTAVFVLRVALVNESFSGSSVHKRT